MKFPPFHEMLGEQRSRVGLTPASLAARIGVNSDIVRSWEQGHSSPSAEQHALLVRVVGALPRPIRGATRSNQDLVAKTDQGARGTSRKAETNDQPRTAPRPKSLGVAEVRALLARRSYLPPCPHLVVPPRSARPLAQAEAEVGEQLYAYCCLRRLVVVHVPNERVSMALLPGLLSQGMQLGWPDYTFARPVRWGGEWRSFHLEIKSFDGWKMSRNQGDRIEELRADGQIAEVAWGYDECQQYVDALYGFS